MSIIVTTLSDRRREKRWRFERSVLQKLSLEELKENVEEQFQSVVPLNYLSQSYLLDPSMDIAIDIYLMGAAYGRFGYMGESENDVMLRCEEELLDSKYSLFYFMQGWLLESDYMIDSLIFATDAFVVSWWKKGFQEGEKQYRLRLH